MIDVVVHSQEDGSTRLFISGINPESWATPTFNRKTGFPMPKKKMVNYQKALTEALSEALAGANIEPYPKGIPISLSVMFIRSTTASRPVDTSNVFKATEDALQGLLFENDRDVKVTSCVQVAQSPGLEPAIGIEVAPLVGDDYGPEWFHFAASSVEIDLPEVPDVVFDASDF